MDASSSPAMRYIKGQTSEDYVELDTEGKFRLLNDAVDTLEARGILADVIGNRTLSTHYRNFDRMIPVVQGTDSHEIASRHLRFICSRSWEHSTDYFFLTLDKHWYWLRTSSDPISRINRFVSLHELQWQLAAAITERSREDGDIFQQLLEALVHLVGQVPTGLKR